MILEPKKIKSVTASTFFYLLKIFIFHKEHIFMICISLDILLSKKVIILKSSQFSHYLLLKINRLIRVSIYKVISWKHLINYIKPISPVSQDLFQVNLVYFPANRMSIFPTIQITNNMKWERTGGMGLIILPETSPGASLCAQFFRYSKQFQPHNTAGMEVGKGNHWPN